MSNFTDCYIMRVYLYFMVSGYLLSLVLDCLSFILIILILDYNDLMYR